MQDVIKLPRTKRILLDERMRRARRGGRIPLNCLQQQLEKSRIDEQSVCRLLLATRDTLLQVAGLILPHTVRSPSVRKTSLKARIFRLTNPEFLFCGPLEDSSEFVLKV